MKKAKTPSQKSKGNEINNPNKRNREQVEMGIVELVEESERERRVLWTTIYRAKIGEYREKIGRKKGEKRGR